MLRPAKGPRTLRVLTTTSYPTMRAPLNLQEPTPTSDSPAPPPHHALTVHTRSHFCCTASKCATQEAKQILGASSCGRAPWPVLRAGTLALSLALLELR